MVFAGRFSTWYTIEVAECYERECTTVQIKKIVIACFLSASSVLWAGDNLLTLLSTIERSQQYRLKTASEDVNLLAEHFAELLNGAKTSWSLVKTSCQQYAPAELEEFLATCGNYANKPLLYRHHLRPLRAAVEQLHGALATQVIFYDYKIEDFFYRMEHGVLREENAAPYQATQMWFDALVRQPAEFLWENKVAITAAAVCLVGAYWYLHEPSYLDNVSVAEATTKKLYPKLTGKERIFKVVREPLKAIQVNSVQSSIKYKDPSKPPQADGSDPVYIEDLSAEHTLPLTHVPQETCIVVPRQQQGVNCSLEATISAAEDISGQRFTPEQLDQIRREGVKVLYQKEAAKRVKLLRVHHASSFEAPASGASPKKGVVQKSQDDSLIHLPKRSPAQVNVSKAMSFLEMFRAAIAARPERGGKIIPNALRNNPIFMNIFNGLLPTVQDGDAVQSFVTEIPTLREKLVSHGHCKAAIIENIDTVVQTTFGADRAVQGDDVAMAFRLHALNSRADAAAPLAAIVQTNSMALKDSDTRQQGSHWVYYKLGQATDATQGGQLTRVDTIQPYGYPSETDLHTEAKLRYIAETVHRQAVPVAAIDGPKDFGTWKVLGAPQETADKVKETAIAKAAAVGFPVAPAKTS